MQRILRSRPGSISFRSYCRRPFSSNISENHPKEAIFSSSSSELLINDQLPSVPLYEPAPTPKKLSSFFLKFSLFGTIAGATAAAGYVSYAYTLDEVDEKTKAFRALPNYTVGENASSLDKFQALLYSAAMKVPAKVIKLYLDLRRPIEEQIQGFVEPLSEKLLPDLHPKEQHLFTLVLDLSETLLYSDWKRERGWRTFKRPGVDDFLEHLACFYEIVVYSDQQCAYVNPVLKRLNRRGLIRHKLSRAATKYQDGKHYRDLSKLNRDPSKILYVSGHAIESCLQPENCVPIKPWKAEADDTALLDLIPFLDSVGRNRRADVRQVLASYRDCDIASEFIARSKDHQRRMQEEKISHLIVQKRPILMAAMKLEY